MAVEEEQQAVCSEGEESSDEDHIALMSTMIASMSRVTRVSQSIRKRNSKKCEY